jgi:large subunit ribosomal protein L29
MKMKEIRELSDEELQAELGRLRRHEFDLRAQAVTEKLEDPSLITKTKRDIARLLTAITERQAQAALDTAGQQA